MTAYYNEHDPFAVAWLRNLVAAGLIAPGDVDERSIEDVQPSELERYTQCHFFAGIGGWSYALRVAGWPDSRHVWTGSCPCQPFSLAGKQRGFDDERHLWPVWHKLIAQRRPAIIFGEQVASASKWLRLVRGDLEAMGYAVGAMPIEAASAGADHLRDRYWFVANDGSGRRAGPGWGQSEQPGRAETISAGEVIADPREWLREGRQRNDHSDAKRGDRSSQLSWVVGADGKARRVKPGIRLLAHGVPNRVGLLRGFGNAIDPRPAAAFIQVAVEYAP